MKLRIFLLVDCHMATTIHIPFNLFSIKILPGNNKLKLAVYFPYHYEHVMRHVTKLQASDYQAKRSMSIGRCKNKSSCRLVSDGGLLVGA